jgi:hypothetical protein
VEEMLSHYNEEAKRPSPSSIIERMGRLSILNLNEPPPLINNASRIRDSSHLSPLRG